MRATITADEVGRDLVVFGNYRVLRTQQLCHGTHMPASVLMALGLHETGCRNICGGAELRDGKWVQAFTDRGCFQISDQVSDERLWLASVPGCKNGQWSPTDPLSRAIDDMHVPRFTDAAIFAIGKAEFNREQAVKHGVLGSELVRFCVAAHNAGLTGALEGYKVGDVDLHTAHGDYSARVMEASDLVHNWVIMHPRWRWTGQLLGLAVGF